MSFTPNAYAPGWQDWLTEEGRITLTSGYLLPDETQNCMFARLATTAAEHYFQLTNDASFAQTFTDAIYHAFTYAWLSPASPVAANFGAKRGLPVSCFGLYVPNTIDGIFSSVHEAAMLSKNGGGLGVYLGEVNALGKDQSNVLAWAKHFDLVANTVAQGKGIRKGSVAIYLPIRHPDIQAFIAAKDALTGDIRDKLDCNIAVCITDEFMQSVLSGNDADKSLFAKVLEFRLKFGSPYIHFTDNVKRGDPPWYKELGLSTKAAQLCDEIQLHSDAQHTYACVLSSINLRYWHAWRKWLYGGYGLTFWALLFLDMVNEEFLLKGEQLPMLDKAFAGARKGRPLGLGVFGWHTLLMESGIPFVSESATELTHTIFGQLQKSGKHATEAFVSELKLESPEWCKGWGRRNTHLFAIAPTTTSGLIANGGSPGIEPIASNYGIVTNDKTTFVRKNPVLFRLLETKGLLNQQTIESIAANDGSVQHLTELTDAERELLKTAREIDQSGLIAQAAIRQQYIDQGQSLNLFLPSDISAQHLWKLHFQAWRSGLKGLYYVRSKSVALQAVQELGRAPRSGQTDAPKYQPSLEHPAHGETLELLYRQNLNIAGIHAKYGNQLRFRLTTRADCVWCIRAKTLLDLLGYEYVEQIQYSGIVPEVWLNEQLIGGCEGLYAYFNVPKVWAIARSAEAECSGCDG